MIMFYRLAHFTLFPLEEVRIEMTFKDMFKQWTSILFHTNYLGNLSKHTYFVAIKLSLTKMAILKKRR